MCCKKILHCVVVSCKNLKIVEVVVSSSEAQTVSFLEANEVEIRSTVRQQVLCQILCVDNVA